MLDAVRAGISVRLYINFPIFSYSDCPLCTETEKMKKLSLIAHTTSSNASITMGFQNYNCILAHPTGFSYAYGLRY